MHFTVFNYLWKPHPYATAVEIRFDLRQLYIGSDRKKIPATVEAVHPSGRRGYAGDNLEETSVKNPI